MEEIKNKAFDDELNKASETIEGNKVDKTPLPPRSKKKERKERKDEE